MRDRLCRTTVESLQLADRHHQEQNSPVIFMRASVTRQHSIDIKTEEHEELVFSINGSVHNVGPGPAFNVRVALNWYEDNDWWIIPLIPASGAENVSRARLTRSNMPDPRPTCNRSVDDVSSFRAEIEFENAFQGRATTIQEKVNGGDLLITQNGIPQYVARLASE